MIDFGNIGADLGFLKPEWEAFVVDLGLLTVDLGTVGIVYLHFVAARYYIKLVVPFGICIV